MTELDVTDESLLSLHAVIKGMLPLTHRRSKAESPNQEEKTIRDDRNKAGSRCSISIQHVSDQ